MANQPLNSKSVRKYQLFIDGDWVDPASGEWFESHEPFSGKAWALIPKGNAVDVERAVMAAHKALEGPWADLSASERGMLLHRLGELIEVHAEELAEAEMRDNGKVRSEVIGQVKYVAKYYYYYGGLADKIQGDVIPIDKPGVFNYTVYEPLGVVASITPWNSSLLLTAWKLAPALAAGNTVVCKPSEFTSASLFEFASLAKKAGFPSGVINVVAGFASDVGEPLCAHPLVARIAFTGGPEGGRRVNEIAARHMKRVSLELGGKSPNIVFDDADLKKAANGVITGIFSATGQTCMAGSRLLVQEGIHDEFVQRLVEITRGAKIGDPSSPETQIGPITTKAQFDRVISYINIAKQQGAHCAAGGRALSGAEYGQGQFVEPTIFTDVMNSMRIAQEEVFGPVLAVIRFKDEQDALNIGNDIAYGLAAGVWTQSLRRAMYMAKNLKAGTVWINNYRSTSYMTPFGGYKQSGIGREGGVDAIKEYLQVKSVWMSSDLDMPNPFVRRY